MSVTIHQDMTLSPEEIKQLYKTTPKEDKVVLNVTLLREDAEYIEKRASEDFKFDKARRVYELTKIIRSCREKEEEI